MQGFFYVFYYNRKVITNTVMGAIRTSIRNAGDLTDLHTGTADTKGVRKAVNNAVGWHELAQDAIGPVIGLGRFAGDVWGKYTSGNLNPDEVVRSAVKMYAPLDVLNTVAEKTTGTDLMDGFIRGTTTNPDGTPISSSKYSPGVRVPPMMF